MKNTLVIGGSIIVGFIIAALIVSTRLPRYQYIEHELVEKDKEFTNTTTTERIFDMVTGIRYTATSVTTVDEAGNYCGAKSFISQPSAEPLLDTWLKKREAFGDKPFTPEQWGEWKKTHGLK